jgi:hypothetical protein
VDQCFISVVVKNRLIYHSARIPAQTTNFGETVYFIGKSINLFLQRFIEQIASRRERFDINRTPKRVFSFWFFVFTLGQIGIITSLIWAGINGQDVIDALEKQAKSGNFLTFEISLILSCLIYYFEEYGEEPIKALWFLRITLLILSMLIGFLAMLNYIYINSAAAPVYWSRTFAAYNVLLYIAGVSLSYCMYITFSVVEKSAADDMKAKTAAAIDAADHLSSTNVGNVGSKKINLEG